MARFFVVTICAAAEDVKSIMTKKSEFSKYLAALGCKGGQATAKKRTPEQRKEAARKAAQARWAKEKKARKES